MRKIASGTIACFVALLTCGSIVAQVPQTPTPGPEVRRFANWVGTWQEETKVHKTPFSPEGTITGTSSCEWFTGNFHLICRGESSGIMGKVAAMMTIGWHAGRKVYLLQAIESTGMTTQMTGTVSGNTWTFTSEGPAPDGSGKMGKARMTLVDVSPTQQTLKFEVSEDNGPWMLLMEGKSTRK